MNTRLSGWLEWLDQLEDMLEHSLDGDLEDDGYSIEEASDKFDEGVSVEEYFREIQGRPQYQDWKEKNA